MALRPPQRPKVAVPVSTNCARQCRINEWQLSGFIDGSASGRNWRKADEGPLMGALIIHLSLVLLEYQKDKSVLWLAPAPPRPLPAPPRTSSNGPGRIHDI